MKREIPNLIHTILVVSSLIALHCNMPSDPTDPSKTKMSAVFKNADSKFFGNTVTDTVGKPLSIGAALYLPVNFDSISLEIKENDIVTFDTTFNTFRSNYFYDTVWCTRTFTTEGNKNVTFTPFSTPSLQPLTTNVPIVAKSDTSTVLVTFLKNNTSATGTMPGQSYTSGKTFTLPENAYVNQGYIFSGWSTTATGSVEYTNKEIITLGTDDLVLYAVWMDKNNVTPTSLTPSIVHAPSQLIAGKADTLLFAVDNSSGSDPLTISLITDTPLDPEVFSIVATGSDTVMIAVSQSADPTTATFGIITSNGTKSDTAKYTITLISSNVALWNTTSVDLDAVEGSQYKLDLSQYLSNENGEGVSLSADSGTIDNINWSYNPPWGCAEKLTATITAKKEELLHTLTLNLTVAAGDANKPQLSLVDASLDGKKVSSAQITVECKATDAGAGVESVVFTCGEQQVTGTLQGEDVYSGVITGLMHNIPTTITVTANDKSRQKNSATLNLSITRDTTMLDAEPPVIVKTAGPESGARVNNAEGSLTFTVTDNSGIDSVWWTLNDVPRKAIVKETDGKYTLTYTLSAFGDNTITLFARDGSSNKNSGNTKMTLVYNSTLSTIAATTPADKATDISVTPSFTWSGGEDADGDTVYYKVLYGTAAASLTTVLSETKEPSAAIAAENALTANTAYYWKVLAYTKTPFKDTMESGIVSFTTSASVPVITTNLTSALEVIEGEKLELKVIAEASPEPTYQWYKDNAPLTAQTAAVFSKTGVTGADEGTYHVVVSNGVGAGVPSAKTIVTVATKVAITENPTDVTIDEGESATFTVKATGKEPLIYQWYKNGVAISGAATATYKIDAVSVTDDGKKFLCKVNNAFSDTTSTEATLSVTAKHTVTFDLDGGSPAVDPVRVKNGEMVSEPTTKPTKAGHVFLGWYPSKTATSAFAFTTTPITSDMTILAKWEQLIITFDSQGGSPNPPQKTVDYNSLLDEPNEPALEGYQFGGWYKEPGCINAWTFTSDKTTQTMTLYAKWTVIQYKVVFNAQSGSPTPTTQYVNYGGYATEPTGQKLPTLKSYELEGWYTEPSLVNKWSFGTQVLKDYTLHAKWIIRDADGNVYSEVTINGNVWMVGNLKTTQYNDGTPIKEIANQSDWDNQTTNQSAYCWYSKNPFTKEPYGALYNWNAVNSGKLAPKGWHVASLDEWNSLFESDHYELKEYGDSHWEESCGSNASGFTAVGSGARTTTFYDLKKCAYFWTADLTTKGFASMTIISPSNTSATFASIINGCSVRCVKDK